MVLRVCILNVLRFVLISVCFSFLWTGPMGLSAAMMGGAGSSMMGMAPAAAAMPATGGFVTSTGPLNVAAGSTPTATTLESAKAYVGRLIGRGGETINQIQSRSGARVQIEQNVPEGCPCRVNITGNPQNVAIAAQIVQDIIVNGPNSAAAVLASAPNMGGGGGGMMQGGGGYYGAPGGMGGYGMPQQQMYGGGYGQQQGMGMYQQQGSGYNSAPQQQQPVYGQQQQQQPVYGQQQPVYGQQQYGAAAGAGNGWGEAAGGHMRSAPPTKVLPAGWTEHKTEDGNTYWHNASTGVSQVSISAYCYVFWYSYIQWFWFDNFLLFSSVGAPNLNMMLS
jgi:rRNA processing protein Krr1/Pno1